MWAYIVLTIVLVKINVLYNVFTPTCNAYVAVASFYFLVTDWILLTWSRKIRSIWS